MDSTLLSGKCNPIESLVSHLEKQRLSRSQNPTSREDDALTTQFLEYASTHLVVLSDANLSIIRTVLKEVNEMLSNKVFLMGHKKTVVDVIYYRLIYPAMSKLSVWDKENFVHVSRWFDHLQNDDSVRQSKSLVVFNRTLLFV